jgi:hypothetical protein
MNNQTFSNVCIRCGKQRVIVDSSKELVGTAMVTSTTSSCPDEECQKIVDQLLLKEKTQRERFQNMKKYPYNANSSSSIATAATAKKN